MKSFFYILLTIFSFSNVLGQSIPFGLHLDKVQEEITQKTSEFDSLIFVDISSYWQEDKKIEGFGFKENDIFKVTIIFKKDTTSFCDIRIDKTKKKRVTNKSKLNAIKNIDYSAISIISNDALNLKTRTNISMEISDQALWSMLIINKNNFVLKQSYAPEIYQKKTPTIERQTFMAILIKIKNLLE